MGRFQMVRIPFPLRGLNEDENPSSLKDADLVQAENVYFRGNGVGTRPGLEDEGASEDYENALAGTPAINGIHEFRYGVDANRKMVVTAGTNIYADDGTTVTGTCTLTAGADNYRTFAEHKDALYSAGGANGDTFFKYTGTGNASAVTFQSDTNADGAADTSIDCKYVFQKWNYGFAAGMNGTLPDDNPMVVRYSALNDMDSWPVANTIGGTSAVGGLDAYGDNYITGLADWTDNKGDWLLILTRKRIYSVVQNANSLDPFYVDSEIQNGCVGQRAFVSLGTDSGEAIYMSEYGIHSLRQSQEHGLASDRFLSWPIRKTFAGLRRSRLKYTRAAYWPDEGLVVFLVTSGQSATAHNMMLILDVRGVESLTADTARWSVWRLGGSTVLNEIVTARAGTAYTSAPLRYFVYGGTTAGRICRFNPLAAYSDRGTGFTSRVQTAHRNMGLPGTTKGLGDVWIHLQRSSGTSFDPILRPIYNYGAQPGAQIPFTMTLGGATLGSTSTSFIVGVSALSSAGTVQQKHLYGTGAGDSIGWLLETSGAGQAWWLTELAYQVRTFGEQISGEAA